MMRLRIVAATLFYWHVLVLPSVVSTYRTCCPEDGKKAWEVLVTGRLGMVFFGIGMLAGLVWRGAVGTERQRAKREQARLSEAGQNKGT